DVSVGATERRFGSIIFFFQAEDGIRDWSVTGVQTCALPIFQKKLADTEAALQSALHEAREDPASLAILRLAKALAELKAATPERSEERRVGKEGRERGGAERGKRKR